MTPPDQINARRRKVSMNNTQHSKFIQQRTRCDICAWGLLLLLPLLALPAVAQGQFSYTTNYDSTITITGYMGPGGAVTIPDTMHGLPVSRIGDGAFSYCTGLASVTIGNGVIGDFAFDGCNSLTSVTIGNGVSSIGNAAFYLCTSLTTITIPNSVTNLGSWVCSGCYGLTNASIGASVTSIGLGAFNACTSLTAITVDALNPAYSSLDGVLFSKNQTTLSEYPAGKTGTSYAIPNRISSVGELAFAGCARLTSVTIPNTVTSIGSGAFGGCTSLSTVRIPDSVTSIGYLAFNGCISLTNVTIGNAVTSIANTMFQGCTNLTNITIPDSVTSLGVEAFNECYGLTTVTIGSGLTSIGFHAFSGCRSLTSLTLPNSVTSIAEEAFYFCTSLASITIGNSVAYLANYAFSRCPSLTGVYFQGNAPSLGGSDVFYRDDNATVYYLPGTTGWGATLGGRPTAPWYLPHPVILDFGPSFGVQTNRFGFSISWATNLPVVVEASTNLANPIWSPLATNTLTNGSSYFSDPQWANYPARFYRLRQP
jgi:hypothetical protein